MTRVSSSTCAGPLAMARKSWSAPLKAVCREWGSVASAYRTSAGGRCAPVVPGIGVCGVRVSARTGAPRARRLWSRAFPVAPVAPMTTIIVRSFLGGLTVTGEAGAGHADGAVVVPRQRRVTMVVARAAETGRSTRRRSSHGAAGSGVWAGSHWAANHPSRAAAAAVVMTSTAVRSAARRGEGPPSGPSAVPQPGADQERRHGGGTGDGGAGGHGQVPLSGEDPGRTGRQRGRGVGRQHLTPQRERPGRPGWLLGPGGPGGCSVRAGSVLRGGHAGLFLVRVGEAEGCGGGPQACSGNVIRWLTITA